MNCPSCGREAGEGTVYCPYCGVQMAPPEIKNTPPAPPAPASPIPRRAFYALYASPAARTSLQAAVGFIYLVAAISLGANLLLMEGYGFLLDIAVILGMALGIQLKQSRVCAVILLVYSIFNCIVMTIANGRLAGWLLIMAAGYAVKGTFALAKEYRVFLQNGGKNDLLHGG